MGILSDVKAFVTGTGETHVDPDEAYVAHRTQADHDNSPTGRATRTLAVPSQSDTGIKKISKGEALKPTEQGNVPSGDLSLDSGQPVGTLPQITPGQDQAASGQQESNRQASLQASMASAPEKPPVGLDAILHLIDAPAKQVRTAIAGYISKQTGAKVTEANLTEYVAKATAPGDPSGQVVNQLLTGLTTDPLNFLPVIGIPASAYKAAGKAIGKGAQVISDASKAVGVDLAGERGSISTKSLAPTFYSPTQRVIEAKVPNVATPGQIMSTLANSGVSLDEAKWMNLDTFLADKKTVTKDDLLQYVKSHNVEIKEVELGQAKSTNKPEQVEAFVNSMRTKYGDNWSQQLTGPEDLELDRLKQLEFSEGGDHTKFSQYTLPGGTNYREVVLTLPEQMYRDTDGVASDIADSSKNFHSSHFPDQPNPLVHIRLNDRVDGEGKRTLFVEEVQSDWHQKGRTQGYQSPDDQAQFAKLKAEHADVVAKRAHAEGPEYAQLHTREMQLIDEMNAIHDTKRTGVPDAPFKKTWQELAMKRVLRMAAEEGYERIAWTTGAQQAERYDLSKHIASLDATRNGSREVMLQMDRVGGGSIQPVSVPFDRLADHVGKELAEKIINDLKDAAPATSKTYEGLDLKVGGEGMKGFYDDIIPRFVNKYARKWGAKVEDTTISTSTHGTKTGWESTGAMEGSTTTVHSLKFTPEVTNAIINNPQSLMGGVFQTVEEHVKTLPRMMLDKLKSDETGSASVTASLALTRAILGGLAGGVAGDEENAIRNAIIGAGLGVIASPKLIANILSKLRGGMAGTKPASTATANTTAPGSTISGEAIPTLTAPPLDVQHFQKVYQELKDTATRGVHKDVQVADEAALLQEYGVISKDSIAALYPGQAMNSSELTAAADVVSQSLKQVIDHAANVTDDATFQTFLDAFYTHGTLLDPKFLGVQKEAPRALRIVGKDAPVDMAAKLRFTSQFGSLVDKMTPGMDPMELVNMVKRLETPEQAAIFAKNAVKPGLTDAIMSLWVNSLLSGPQTHAANIIGNGSTLGWAVAERQLAGLLGGEVRPGEALAMTQGVFESFTDALRLAGKAWMNNEGTVVPEANKVERPRVSFQDVGMTGIPGQALDYIAATFEALGGRTLMATDEFFKAIAFRAEIHAQGLRKFYSVAEAEGLKGKAARERVKQLTQEAQVDVSSDINTKAQQFASYVTFTKELGPAGQWIADGSANYPVVKLIVPFVKAPTNIFKFAGERTPFALLSKSFWKDIQAGGATRELALSKLATGSMVAGLGTMWAMDGIITGSGPNPKKFNLSVAKEGGWQPYSINVSALKRKAQWRSTEWQSGDKMIAINRIQPLGSLLGLYANYVEIMSNQEDGFDPEELANALLMSTVKVAANQTFIKGLSQTALAFAYPDEFLGETVSKQAVGFVPVIGSAASRAVAREIDPVLREAEGFVETLMKNTPGLSSRLSPTLHPISGEPVYREGGLGLDIASPLYQSTFKNDKVVNEISRNKVNLQVHTGTIHGVELTTAAKTELQRTITHDVKLGGRNLHDALAHLMETSVYEKGSGGPDGRRSLLIKNVFHAFNEAGELLYMKRNPDVKQSVKDVYKDRSSRMKNVAPIPSDESIDASHVDLSVAGY